MMSRSDPRISTAHFHDRVLVQAFQRARRDAPPDVRVSGPVSASVSPGGFAVPVQKTAAQREFDSNIGRDSCSQQVSNTQLIALSERHYSVKELAQMWGLSPAAIRRMFRNEPGVLRFGKQHKGHQRDYVTLRIPLSVAERVYRRCLRPNLVLTLEDR